MRLITPANNVALKFDPTLMELFFGTPGVTHLSADSADPVVWINYAGPVLRYQLYLQVDREVVAVSGDTVMPFGGHSMYEIYVPCTEVVGTPDGYLPGHICLSFYNGDPSLQTNCQMTIRKRPDGELKVWPVIQFPPAHPIVSQRRAGEG